MRRLRPRVWGFRSAATAFYEALLRGQVVVEGGTPAPSPPGSPSPAPAPSPFPPIIPPAPAPSPSPSPAPAPPPVPIPAPGFSDVFGLPFVRLASNTPPYPSTAFGLPSVRLIIES